MDEKRWKPFFPYIGLPVLAAALLLVRWQTNAFTILQSELLLGFGYAAAVTDAKEKRVSNQLVLALLIAWFLSIFPQIVININAVPTLLKYAAFGLLTGAGLFLVVYCISRKGLGGGDVKFMAVAGLYLGMTGTLQAMLIGSILAAMGGLLLILLKRIGRKDTIPLIPFLYVGILIVLFLL